MAATLLILGIFTVALPVVASEPSTTDQLGWQGSPNRRGTWDIILSCGTTIFACTWSIQHLNVPAAQDGISKKALRSCQWMLITVLFPEFIMAHAFFELLMAIDATKAIEAKVNIAVTYPPLIRRLFLRHTQNNDSEHGKNYKGPEWTLTHSYFANMGGLSFEYTDETDERKCIQFPLTAFQYAEQPDVYATPEIYEDDIKDKGKQDYFAKAIAIVQICWLILSLITRKIRGLAFSQFETLTLGLAVCGVAIYITYWYKPQGVGVPIKVAKQEGSVVPQFLRTYDSFWDVLSNSREKKSSGQVSRIRNDNNSVAKSNKWHMTIIVLAVLSAVFGCIHIIAWNFEFPSDVEKLLWRIATIMSIVVPGLGLTTILLAQFTARDGDPREFLMNCLEPPREFSWFYDDIDATSKAMTTLENIYNNLSSEDDNAQRLYKDILTTNTGSFAPEMLKFIKKESPFEESNSVQLSEKFISQFSFLVELMNDEGPKSLVDSAKTNVFPRRAVIPRWVNMSILYTTNLIYIVSRLMIMALALASLRSMPEEVYITTWTKNLPAIQ
ncbi:uncharacterized protein N7479_004679 [Penicillium vulpinum]|uniref:Uncharacterized protein n=1 Tax=Penicillium vulpinum TaxID=29845 RepID=A0A1V6RLR8_9EURO|nr:uncharacterized protein N7479_004679 [Penicillium vulpinum]KAJ5964803.1 hypothetical protein N7479_004679 [Penicillium vulpinum]OQE02777.1 hypothetical protein PENVUL_c038G10357 [Penicillium vulpinum]